MLRQLERGVLLEVIDRKWREHLYEMDYLKDGVGLRAYAQRDPLVEYQREGFDMFNQMLDGVKEEAVGFLFNFQVQYEEEQEPAAPAQLPGPRKPVRSPRRAASAPLPPDQPTPARNAKCPCGSSRKYKRCHGAPAAP
jgi:preprotein translocase subunit SecA